MVFRHGEDPITLTQKHGYFCNSVSFSPIIKQSSIVCSFAFIHIVKNVITRGLKKFFICLTNHISELNNA